MRQFKIWYLSAEVAPFAKTGGLGDIAGAFPKGLKQANQEIRVIMPKYKMINERKYILREVIRLKDIPVTINGVTKMINVKSAFLPDSKVQIYFIDIPEFFGRVGMYDDVNKKTEYKDNAERFAYFCKGALETLKILSWKPDVIHCNDWQTSFVPLYMKSVYKDDEFMQGIKTIFTVHNLKQQGVYKTSKSVELDIEESFISEGGCANKDGELNLLKGAIELSDVVTTVSPSYEKEIRENSTGAFGLEKTLVAKGDNFKGIINGVDYAVWSPENDKYIPFKFSTDTMEGKEQNKQSLISRVNMDYREGVPVFGMISRVDNVKGYDILLETLEEMLKLDVQVVLLGKGDKQIIKQVEALQKKYPQNLSLSVAFDETLAHMIEAGSDFYLMPSKFEPCGLNQLYSLRYGTIPIVHATGGLSETIEELNFEEATGNGFRFEKYSSKDLFRAFKKALKLYKKKDLLSETQSRIMQEEFTWDESVESFLDNYENQDED